MSQQFSEVKRFKVLGAAELADSVDRQAELRAAMPSVLGLRDLAPLIDPAALTRSSLDMEAAQQLARVFFLAYPRPVFTLEGWYAVRRSVPEQVPSPSLGRTWTELRPGPSLLTGGVTAQELHALDEWLALAQVLTRYDREALKRFGFYHQDERLVAHAAIEVAEITAAELRGLAESVLARIRDLAPSFGKVALERFERTTPAEGWWVPADIAAPPSTEPVAQARAGFTREDVERVLNDL